MGFRLFKALELGLSERSRLMDENLHLSRSPLCPLFRGSVLHLCFMDDIWSMFHTGSSGKGWGLGPYVSGKYSLLGPSVVQHRLLRLTPVPVGEATCARMRESSRLWA